MPQNTRHYGKRLCPPTRTTNLPDERAVTMVVMTGWCVCKRVSLKRCVSCEQSDTHKQLQSSFGPLTFLQLAAAVASAFQQVDKLIMILRQAPEPGGGAISLLQA